MVKKKKENQKKSQENGSEVKDDINSIKNNQPAADQAEDEKPALTIEEALAEEKDRYLRLFAEFENYKRRTSKERIELFKTASHDVMVALLPVLDDFDRALKEMEKSNDALFEGVTLIRNKFFETLKQKGLALIETQVGDPFNADQHEAITQIAAPSDEMKGKIIDIIEKGYLLGEKIIRYPKVVIGQ